MRLRKALEEAVPGLSWGKRKVMGKGVLQGTCGAGHLALAPEDVEPGWAEMPPQAAESRASLRRKQPEPNSPKQLAE